MYKSSILALLIAQLLFTFPVLAQECEETDKKMVKRLRADIEFLADDKLEGRQAGTAGEKKAMEFLSKRMKEIGLLPKGSNGKYIQQFQFSEPVGVHPNTYFQLNETRLKPKKDFYPLSYSANKRIEASGENMMWVGYGIHAPELSYSDYKNRKNLNGKVFVIEVSSPDGIHPHSKYVNYHSLEKRIDEAITRGASGIIFINSDKDADAPSDEFKNIKAKGVPVIFVKKHVFEKLSPLAVKRMSLNVEMHPVRKKAHNVIGFIDNDAESTIVIGAHYDHLGFGDEGSLHRGKPAIHNGADDNASGTAALLELARYFEDKNDTSNNYLFIAFSGEEKGLLGSNYFANHSSIDLKKVNYMINMDMVGRLDKEKNLAISGTGTSSVWEETLQKIQCGGIQIKTDPSGVGPSDHTSFYLKDIPVLHFWTGTHRDYHKPSDDSHKINYEGEAFIVAFIESLIHDLDSKGKIDFIKTKNDENKDTPRFKVTLGVIPDYIFDGEGMRIDGVTEGRPASNAGLKEGDIVIHMGHIEVTDMHSYMKALSVFEKGQTTKVTVKRAEEKIVVDVTF